jgi:hypothetical protein
MAESGGIEGSYLRWIDHHIIGCLVGDDHPPVTVENESAGRVLHDDALTVVIGRDLVGTVEDLDEKELDDENEKDKQDDPCNHIPPCREGIHAIRGK